MVQPNYWIVNIIMSYKTIRRTSIRFQEGKVDFLRKNKTIRLIPPTYIYPQSMAICTIIYNVFVLQEALRKKKNSKIL